MPALDDDLPGSDALGIVPVDVDDRLAPLGCVALREVHGRPLLYWAATALAASGVVPRVLVAVPPALERAVGRVLAGLVPDGVEVVPIEADGPGSRILAALRGPGGGNGNVVVVHDPLHPLASAALVRDVVRELVRSPACAGSAPACAVTDTLKWVDEDEVVLDTADRAGYRMIYSPQAYRRTALLAALGQADDAALRSPGPEVLLRLLQARKGRVTLVPAPAEAFRVATEDDLVLVEALLSPTEVQGSR